MLHGNENAFAELVARYQDKVYGVCLKLTHDASVAEEIAQEAFIKGYVSLPSFRGDASFSTWLYRIAVRCCLDWRRKNAKEKIVQMPEFLPDILSSNEKGPEQIVLDKEREQEAIELVTALKEPYRTVIKLFYFEEKSYQEIAEITGAPIKTVESQLYRARRALRSKGGEL